MPVHSYWWSFVADASPGVTLILVGFLAAMPPYVLLRPSGRGRARSAIAYLSGLATGLVATVLMAGMLLAFVDLAFVDTDAIAVAGLFSSFFCPFVGMARAKWDRPPKKPRRAAMVRGLPQ